MNFFNQAPPFVLSIRISSKFSHISIQDPSCPEIFSPINLVMYFHYGNKKVEATNVLSRYIINSEVQEMFKLFDLANQGGDLKVFITLVIEIINQSVQYTKLRENHAIF